MVSDHRRLFLAKYGISDDPAALGDQDVISDPIKKPRMLKTRSKPSGGMEIRTAIERDAIP